MSGLCCDLDEINWWRRRDGRREYTRDEYFPQTYLPTRWITHPLLGAVPTTREREDRDEPWDCSLCGTEVLKGSIYWETSIPVGDGRLYALCAKCGDARKVRRRRDIPRERRILELVVDHGEHATRWLGITEPQAREMCPPYEECVYIDWKQDRLDLIRDDVRDGNVRREDGALLAKFRTRLMSAFVHGANVSEIVESSGLDTKTVVAAIEERLPTLRPMTRETVEKRLAAETAAHA